MRTPTQRHFFTYTIEHILGVFSMLTIALVVGYVASAEQSSVATLPPVDVIQPIPPQLQLISATSDGVKISWSGATDNVGVIGYKIFRNNAFIAGVTGSTYIDKVEVSPSLAYSYTVRSLDSAGNESQGSNVVQTSGVISTPRVSFSVTIAPLTDCQSDKPMTEVLLLVSDVTGGDFDLLADNGIDKKNLTWGRYLLPNGIYTWKANVKQGFSVNGDAEGSFTLNGICSATSSLSSFKSEA